MDKTVKLNLFCFLFLFLSSITVSLSKTTPYATTLKTSNSLTKSNPFSPKSSLTRYWKTQISNKHPIPSFLLSKSSPLQPLESSLFTKLASNHSLSTHLSSFCSTANLFCFTESTITNSNQLKDSNFALYDNKRFNNYGGAADTFKNYSENTNFATSGFTKYSGVSTATGHHEGFTSYATDANVASSNFTTYAGDATGGNGDFNSYMPRVNVPDLRFTTYAGNGNNHPLTFKSYVDDTNSGNQQFTNYAKNGNRVPVGFTSYGDTSNVVGSTFSHYGELANAANDSFKGYSTNANNPKNVFKAYGDSGGNAGSGSDTFVSYRDRANSGSDLFWSYGRKAKSGRSVFVNYGKSFNPGSDSFREYGRGSTGQRTGFSSYALNTTFKDYSKTGVTFAQYTKRGSNEGSKKANDGFVNKWSEPVKFFREKMLKKGTVMMMPDIVDKMPRRSFLPRTITSKLPFATKKLSELKEVFQARENSVLERVLTNTLAECERAPSPGETKQCVGSVEDMVDFAVSVLGHDVVVRTTENVIGSKKEVMIGEVNGVNGGKLTKSVSCHQSLYPYLLYYCHSVPKVRVYVAEILDVSSKEKINTGVAICHIDTSSWSPGHGAFIALGSGPGRIEVCHWIFENDMTWTTADY